MSIKRKTKEELSESSTLLAEKLKQIQEKWDSPSFDENGDSTSYYKNFQNDPKYSEIFKKYTLGYVWKNNEQKETLTGLKYVVSEDGYPLAYQYDDINHFYLDKDGYVMWVVFGGTARGRDSCSQIIIDFLEKHGFYTEMRFDALTAIRPTIL